MMVRWSGEVQVTLRLMSNFKSILSLTLELQVKDETMGQHHIILFFKGVGMFDFIFLSCFFTKMRSICTHWTLERKFPEFFKTHPTFVHF